MLILRIVRTSYANEANHAGDGVAAKGLTDGDAMGTELAANRALS